MLQQVLVDGRIRRLVVVHRASRLVWGVTLVIAGGLAVTVGLGWGGSLDGTAGTLIALVVLCGGAFLIQRVSKRRVLVGFNPDGLYAPAHGWIGWDRVRRIEVRRTGNVVTGRRTVMWVAFQGDAAGAEGSDGSDGPVWLPVNPGWSPARTVKLVDDMERVWTGRRPPAPSAHPNDGGGGGSGVLDA